MKQPIYTDSHPWITFRFNPTTLPPGTLLLLGEALSKCDHVAGSPLPPGAARDLNQVFLTKGIHATTSIEGNTLTEEEVRRRVDGDLKLPDSLEYQGEEVDNLLAVLNEIQDELHNKGALVPLTVDKIKQWNRSTLKGQPVEDEVVPGEFRTHSVVVGNVYRGAPAEDCDYLMDRFVTFINEDLQTDDDTWRRPIGIIRAILAHLYLAWIHPFGDGNGRTARLIEFHLLVEAGLPVPAAHLLSDYYNKSRPLYYQSLARASRLPNLEEGVSQFIAYAVRGFVEGLQQQVSAIEDIQLNLSWVNFIHEVTSEKHSDAWKRKRQLALALSHTDAAVSRSELTHISPDLAAQYATKTAKSLSRDLGDLMKLDLIRKVDRKSYASNKQIMLAFRPPTVEQPR